jgi:hypothetical protein
VNLNLPMGEMLKKQLAAPKEPLHKAVPRVIATA